MVDFTKEIYLFFIEDFQNLKLLNYEHQESNIVAVKLHIMAPMAQTTVIWHDYNPYGNPTVLPTGPFPVGMMQGQKEAVNRS